jgi:chemotaxis protein methyltransferase WspC
MPFAEFEELLKQSMGLDAASIGAPAIKRAVVARASACGIAGSRAYWEYVADSPSELQALIEAIVVPETWFFRDHEAFATLARMVEEKSLTPHTHDRLRLLSLPSSTGEEPYSIAMALFDAGLAADRFSVTAVDISARVIAEARRATYGRNSFRGRELEFRSRHFEPVDTKFRLSDRVRRQVQFRQGNLFGSGWSTAGAYDAIFCRNLLIYFDRQTQDRALAVLARQLAPNGLLFVAPSETGVLLQHGFVAVKAPRASAFRKAPLHPPAAAARKSAHPPMPLPIAPRPGHSNRHTEPAPLSSASRADTNVRSVAAAPLADAADLANRGRFDEAMELCEQHVRQSGPSAEAFILMALVRDASGNAAEAMHHYRKALYLDPNHREALAHLGLLLERTGQHEEALLLRKRAKRLTNGKDRTGVSGL